MIRRLFKILGDTHRDAQDEQRRQLTEGEDGYDWETTLVLLTSALALTCRHYLRLDDAFWIRCTSLLPSAWSQSVLDWRTASENQQLASLIDWVLVQTIAFFVMPLLCCLALRVRLTDYGCKIRGAARGWPASI